MTAVARLRPLQTTERCTGWSRTIHEHLDPRSCPECAALSGLVIGLVAMARQGHAPQMVEHLLAQCAGDLSADDPWGDVS